MDDLNNIEPAETPAPTVYNNQGNENEDDIHINIDSESYKLTMYIEFTSLVIMLEPGDNNPDKILQNSFNIAELKSLHKSLKVSENLEDAKNTLIAFPPNASLATKPLYLKDSHLAEHLPFARYITK